MQPLLTIAIPTYNRCLKVKRLLDRLVEIHELRPWGKRIELLVSDNASTDDTSGLVKEYVKFFPTLRYHRQVTNCGFDGNVLDCYHRAQGQYVWFHSDDDLPDIKSADTILEALDRHQPDLLRFSFRQPADALTGAFQFDEPVHIDSDLVRAIELVMRFPKVSTYVLRRVAFEKSIAEYHQSTIGDGFSFVILGLSVLQAAAQPLVAVLSETLACCDADYKTLDWPPQVILNSYRQAEHPLVRLHCPKLAASMKYKGYMHAIDLAYQVQQGQYSTSVPKAYENFGAAVPYRLRYLIKRPKYLFRLWTLKRAVIDANYQTAKW